MEFEATNDQVRRLLATAVNASSPAAGGPIPYDLREYVPDEFEDHHLFRGLDRYAGRQVMLPVGRVRSGRWHLPDVDPHPRVQTWAVRYPTYRALLAAAGIGRVP